MNYKIFARKIGGQFAPVSGGQFARSMQYGVDKTIEEYGAKATELTQDKYDYEPQTGESGFEDLYLNSELYYGQAQEAKTTLDDEIKKDEN